VLDGPTDSVDVDPDAPLPGAFVVGGYRGF
jgi:hypothetical protein